MKRFFKVVMLLVLVVSLLTGCGRMGKKLDLKADEMLPKRAVTTTAFTLDKTFITDAGDNAQITGSVNVPENAEKCPVVFVMGESDNAYLASELASYGTLVFDVNAKEKSVEECEKLIRILLDEIKADNKTLGDTISSKADEEQIAFAGVGTYAGISLALAESFGDITKGVYMAEAYLAKLSERYADVNVGIVVHQNDTKSDSQEIFESLREDRERTSFTSYAYMYDANNTADEKNAFIARYGADFMNAAFMMQDNPALVMLSTYNTDETLYGIKTKTAFSGPEKAVIADTVFKMHPRAAQVSVKNASTTPEINETGGFVLPGMIMDLDLQKCNWDNEGVEILIDEEDKSPRYAIYTENMGVKDFSEYKYLTFYLTPNPADKEYYRVDNKQKYSVRIVDNKNNSQTVEIDDKLNVYFYEEAEHNEQTGLYSVPTPMGTLAVPLGYFDKIDLSDVKIVNFVIEEVDTGSLMMGDVSLVKAMDR